MAAITRLGHYGGPRGLYGSFAGKSQVLVKKQGGKKKKPFEAIQFKYEEKPKGEPSIRLPESIDYELPPESYTPGPIGELTEPSTAQVQSIISEAIEAGISKETAQATLVSSKSTPKTLSESIRKIDEDEQLLLLLLAA